MYKEYKIVEGDGFWANLHAKKKRLGVKKLGKTGGGEGSSFKSKKELDKLVDKINKSSSK